jgi:mRNA interferase MazF
LAREVRRGEIWTAAGGGGYAGKPRPVLVVQDDAFADTASVTVCLLTTQALDAALLRPALAPTSGNGLREPSWAMVDKITTVPRERMRERIGALSPTALRAVNRAIIVFLGLAA